MYYQIIETSLIVANERVAFSSGYLYLYKYMNIFLPDKLETRAPSCEEHTANIIKYYSIELKSIYEIRFV